MSEIVISAEGLGKKYVIGQTVARDGTLRDAISRYIENFIRALKRPQVCSKSEEEIRLLCISAVGRWEAR